MASAIYILDQNLNLLIQRQYKYDLNSTFIVDNFQKAFKKQKNPDLNSPILAIDNLIYVYLRIDEIYLMTPTFEDLNLMGLVSFLSKFGSLLKSYFIEYKLMDKKKGKLTSDLIKDNYILIYELFDETADFGIPQLTEFNILREYIKLIVHDPESLVNGTTDSTVDDQDNISREINSSISRTSTTKVSWRPKGIFYNKNEFFVNMNEHLRFKFHLNENRVIFNSITGEMNCKCFLSGMPKLTLAINENFKDDKTVFTSINFHQSVELSEEIIKDEKEENDEEENDAGSLSSSTVSVKSNKKETSNQIQFIPPDGDFRLANYQIIGTVKLKPLVLVVPTYKLYYKNGKYKLKIKATTVTSFKKRSKNQMKDVKIKIPIVIPNQNLCLNFVPSTGSGLKFKTKLGNVVHNLKSNCIFWQISQMEGNSKGEMVAEFELISKKQVAESHEANFKRGKQNKNDLIYYDLTSELTLEKMWETENRLLTVEFKLNITYSDLKISYLKIEEAQLKFQSFPWIKYNTYCNGEDYCFVVGEKQLRVDLSEEELAQLEEENKEEEEFDEADTTIEEIEAAVDSLINGSDSGSESQEGDEDHHDPAVAPKTNGKYKYGSRFIDFEEYVVEEEQEPSLRSSAETHSIQEADDYEALEQQTIQSTSTKN